VADLLLLSGGLDSTALAALAQPDCLTVDYGQKTAKGEFAASVAVARELALNHFSVAVDCSAIGSGLLAGGSPDAIAPSEEWWPYRNQLLVTLAAAWALPRGYDRIFIASVAPDSFHRDGTANFFAMLSALIQYQEGELEVVAPAIADTSIELARRARLDRRILGWTFSCHRDSIPCGDCPGCNKRRGVLAEIGVH
jgi:7-cyano-7-deazaguanine synthase